MITINIDKQKEEKLLKKVKAISGIAVRSAVHSLQHENTLKWAAGIGLWQGLKYNGNFKRGVRAGLATVGTIVAANVCANLAANYDKIKDS